MTTTDRVLDETPIDYTDEDLRGLVKIQVDDGEDCADLNIFDGKAEVSLRLDRDELAALISTAARALALLS